MDEEKRQRVKWRPYGKCWIDMCSNDLLHKALGFQKMSIQKVSANDFLDYLELNTIFIGHKGFLPTILQYVL